LLGAKVDGLSTAKKDEELPTFTNEFEKFCGGRTMTNQKSKCQRRTAASAWVKRLQV